MTGCYTYDGWLGECRQWHQPEWWEYVNLFSILVAVIAIALVVIVTAGVLWVIRLKIAIRARRW